MMFPAQQTFPEKQGEKIFQLRRSSRPPFGVPNCVGLLIVEVMTMIYVSGEIMWFRPIPDPSLLFDFYQRPERSADGFAGHTR